MEKGERRREYLACLRLNLTENLTQDSQAKAPQLLHRKFTYLGKRNRKASAYCLPGFTAHFLVPLFCSWNNLHLVLLQKVMGAAALLTKSLGGLPAPCENTPATVARKQGSSHVSPLCTYLPNTLEKNKQGLKSHMGS